MEKKEILRIKDKILLICCRDQNTFIKNFTIYGERCSGTKFLTSTIEKSLDIPVIWDYGWKHFYGFCLPKTLYAAKNTLFIGIVRNPYDWICSLKMNPYHLPNSLIYNFDRFLTHEWYSIDKNQEIYEDRNYITGLRYKNIFELRSTKINYLLYNMPKYVRNYIFLTYEQLLSNLNYVLQLMSRTFNLKKNNAIIDVLEKNPYFLEDKYKLIVNKNLDWNTESLIGYSMRA